MLLAIQAHRAECPKGAVSGMDPQELMLTAARAVAVYALMLIVIRALGKRTVGNFAAFDLLVALMLGEVVDEIIYGDVSFVQGTVAIVVIAAAQSSNAWLTWWDHGFHKLLEGTPTVIVRQGELQEDGMRAERMNGKDVIAHLREEGIRDLREVHLAVVEDDGTVSVLKRSWAEPARRADIDKEAAQEKKQDTNGKDEPTGAERTDARQWLE
jgi:uncharacterized membrane protein YcaP (DUF421 family)